MVARKALPQLPNHKQTTVAQYFGISTDGAHRALKDCEIFPRLYSLSAISLNFTNKVNKNKSKYKKNADTYVTHYHSVYAFSKKMRKFVTELAAQSAY